MKKNNYLFCILLVAFFVFVVESDLPCLSSGQNQDECISCKGGQVLVQSKCFKKMRGCLEYKINSEDKLECTKCQSGYVKDGYKCERFAVVQARSSPQSKQPNNSPAPLRLPSIKKLVLPQIKKNPEQSKKEEEEEKTRPTQKPIPQFPAIEILQTQQGGRENNDEQLLKINQKIKRQFPEIESTKMVDIHIFSSNEYQSIKEAVYQDGTRVLVGLNNQEVSILGIRFNTQIADIYNRVQETNHFQINQIGSCTKIGIIDIYTKQSIDMILDQQEQLELIQTILDNNQNKKMKQQLIELLEQENYDDIVRDSLQIAYPKFLEETKVRNVPDIISKIQASIVGRQQSQIQEINYRIFYPSTIQDQQYAEFIYNVPEETITILGYFIEGVNLLQIPQFQRQQQQSSQSPQELSQSSEETKQQTIPLPKISLQEITEQLGEQSQISSVIGQNFEISSSSQSTDNTLEVNVLSENGQFSMKMTVMPDSELKIDHYNPITKLSETTCSTLPSSNQETSSLEKFLAQKYSILKDYPQILIQKDHRKEKTIFRFLYSNQFYGQIQAVIQKSLKNSKPKYKLTDIVSLNEGNKLVSDLKSIKFQDLLTQQSLSSYHRQLSSLYKKYEKYLQDSSASGVFQNRSSIKVYAQNSVYVMEGIIIKSQKSQKIVLKAIDKKKVSKQTLAEEIGIPAGHSESQLVIEEKTPRKLMQNLKKIERKIINKYQYFLGRQYQGFMVLNQTKPETVAGVTLYLFVLKSKLGTFNIDVRIGPKPEQLQIGALNPYKLWLGQQVKRQEQCSHNEFKDSYTKRCIKKIQNCDKQLGNVCIICSPNAILSEKRSQCSIECSDIFRNYI